MALYNLGQLKSQVGQYLGVINGNNTSFTNSTTPTEVWINQAINDSIREVMSEFNYRQTETNCRVPFLHTIYNVNGAYLTGLNLASTTGIQATFVPYPQDNLLINCQVLPATYSGIPFIGIDQTGISWSGVSITGSGFTGSVTTIGYQYELPAQVEQIYSVTVPFNAIKLQYLPQYDWDRVVPQGLTIASGTPAYYTMFPGLSISGNLVIQFYPEPTVSSYTDKTFVVHYKRKHADLVSDSDVQRVIPEQFQDIIIWATLEKSYIFMSQLEKSVLYSQKKSIRAVDMKIWADNSLDYVYVARDGDFLSSNPSSAYNTSVLFQL